MQYLLSEDEYRDLVPKADHIALVVKFHNAKNYAVKEIVGDKCVHSLTNVKGGFGYCDECPLGKGDGVLLCDKEKEYSK